ncbi:MAG: PocR ligand-binding domain-containing protein [Candidatus Magnetobacterium sp. LHC-1]|uniref:histidine kinase n=1 Tax=Candidatus Magnetobacterium casense TaxID=1455061 RepID=A0ABS6RVJ4_9BACT|nr:PocR ligand-binding domain-containing protein [Candidatus Magnetobacterium casensis]MBF0606474.1 PocR ligand-binding domain-containing protein [Nitrospirota bacterium]MBV6340298.1 PocR ligand-binding domain-containing protein [Candidatus Magnetobacterium casensis]
MTYKLSELFNIEELHGLFESFTRLTGVITALLDIEGNVLIATGWQPICTGFHRMHPETAMRCRESDTALAGMLKDGEQYNIYRCKNGLVDVAVPIVIDGIHMGNLFTGQFFFASPDVQYFARQAEEFGFDGDKYLEALARVPIFTEDCVRVLMDFLLRLAGQICGMGLSRKQALEHSDKDALKEQETLLESIKETTAQLRKSEEELKRFFDLSIDMLCIADIDGYFRVISLSFSKTLGHTDEELKSRPFIEFVHPDDVEKTLNEVKKLSQGLLTIDFENRYLCKDGRHRHIQWRSSPVPEIGLTYATARDITEQKQMAEAVKTERDKLMGIMDAMQDCIYIVGIDYDIEFVNRATLKEFGEVNSRKCYEYFHDGTGQCPWCRREDVFTEQSVTWEWFCPKNHKTYSHFDTPIRNNDGSTSKFSLMHDISDIKSAQLMMKRELDFQSAVAEVSEALLSPDKDIIDMSLLINRQAMRLTDSLHGHVSEIDRVTEEQVSHTLTEMMSDGQCNVDTRHSRLAFPKGKDGYNALWGHVLNTRQAFYTNDPQKHPAYKGCLPQGHIPLTRYMAVPAMIGDRLIGNIALANAGRDYTETDLDIIKRLASIYALAIERKRLEDELKTLNANLASLVREETAKRQMQEQMLIQQSKMAAMGEMIGLIAHQWKQPLNAIGLIVQDLRDAYKFGELDKNYIDNTIELTMGQVTFMGKTMDDFRNFFKPSKQKVAFDVKNAIDELISMFSPVFIKNNITVNIKVTSPLTLVANGYPNEFKQVILNILNNSKDAIISCAATDASVQGQIEVEIARPLERQGQIVISIRDNGGGIPADVMGRIFEPYFTTKGSEGTGIGLYMSKTIIETNMGGSLVVRNIPGGAEFTISLAV